MPFGFERNLEAENEAAHQMNVNKHFISVKVHYMTDGKIIPASFFWHDREYIIDKVLNCRQGNSLKDITSGWRYECILRNKRFYLYFTGKKWYLDL